MIYVKDFPRMTEFYRQMLDMGAVQRQWHAFLAPRYPGGTRAEH